MVAVYTWWCDDLMTGFTAWVAGASVLNAVVAGVLVLAMYSLMERHIGLGAFGGIAIGAAVIYAEATLGEQMLTVTVAEMKLLVIAAAVGAAVGVTATVLTVKPSLES
ncbi:hypothetical protein GRX01_05120 [Halobaculum sp. WSA2]|uniref:Uncharacterized protein n=1 Tax=Halobaculum saliterrae TaxID=2073113 RepID=A0A6B0SVS5_9EURY|nr:hypothetical protein [Halobaculum saliterrae]MXR40723.1 hypothetical protein [Halobaculum saliterrae]